MHSGAGQLARSAASARIAMLLLCGRAGSLAPPCCSAQHGLRCTRAPLQGYCNASNPKWSAVCSLDDLNGPGCDVVTEAFCPNQCSGHGYCNLGYCK